MKKKWWHELIGYQIYPKSFCDSNGDGIGDLQGIIGKLPYLKDLGVDLIWISPIYRSPFEDQGYDISDYYDIDPVFGTMEDFDELLAKAHDLGLKIVMDLVINHCSSEHEWFQKALADPTGEYGDYFYFRKGVPNNYRSYFGGSAWEPVPGTDLSYLHLFAKGQPDLNWHNPKVLEELYAMINWWLEKGLDGFRIDAIMNIGKDISFPVMEPDGPDGLFAPWRTAGVFDEVALPMLEELKKNTFEKYDAYTVGEAFGTDPGKLARFVGDEGVFSTMFDFSQHALSFGYHGWYDSPEISFEDYRRTIHESQLHARGVGFLTNILENHDEPRGRDRFLPPHARTEEGAKMLATVSVLLRGMPFLYQGQEIGMVDLKMQDVSEYEDINTINEYEVALAAGCSKEEALEACYRNSRDNARMPVSWDGTKNAGFTAENGIPWYRVHPDHESRNVEAQNRDENSVLSHYKALLALRKSPEYGQTFTYGDYRPLFENSDGILAYERAGEEKKICVLANFGTEPFAHGIFGKVIFANGDVTEGIVKPCQAIVLESK